MKKFAACALALASVFTVNTAIAKETITVSGSTSVTGVMEVLAETYSNKTGISVEVQGTGSSAGIKAANEGTSMLGMSSRNVKDTEKRDGLTETVIARDGIAIAVNNKNSLKKLTTEQIAAIYKGEVTNWKEVGGEPGPIVVVTRDTASGTRGAFESILKLKRKVNGMKVSAITPRAQVGNGNGMVKTMVANNPYAIGYISLGSVDSSLRALNVNGSEATVAAIQAGEYPIARPFILLADQNAPKNAKDFTSWILSSEGQQIVAKKGYVALK
ncbi:phosphate ABC transporter substrate-binding protein [Ferrimonas lipolytica]|uniref:Phosphate-binding protein n=1 Tax=Ferrimonas lipolytica TaxID=2724191 RepID=A0A6H1UC32_9GAMM|nr:phosphate ABC transporter substrate-binding protein [Ferrimonas lipolytica]QIZ76140.1 phosphate ABC transporter substrate-binding protein [Ferrimonas lipolytica]